MIKAIIFDCFGVLTEDGWKVFLEDLPNHQAKDTARDLNRQFDANLITSDEFLVGVKQATGRNYDIIKSARSSEDSKNTNLIEYISQLKDAYKIGILSNVATNWVREVLLTPEEQKLFNSMVFSFEVGFIKPDPRIYETSLKELGVQAGEAVFIDDARHNCEAANRLGITSILYQNFNQMKKELKQILAPVANN